MTRGCPHHRRPVIVWTRGVGIRTREQLGVDFFQHVPLGIELHQSPILLAYWFGRWSENRSNSRPGFLLPRGLLLALVLRAPTVVWDLGPAGQVCVAEFAVEGLLLLVGLGIQDDAVLAAKILLPTRIRVVGVQDVNSGPRKVLGTSGRSSCVAPASFPAADQRRCGLVAAPTGASVSARSSRARWTGEQARRRRAC